METAQVDPALIRCALAGSVSRNGFLLESVDIN